MGTVSRQCRERHTLEKHGARLAINGCELFLHFAEPMRFRLLMETLREMLRVFVADGSEEEAYLSEEDDGVDACGNPWLEARIEQLARSLIA